MNFPRLTHVASMALRIFSLSTVLLLWSQNSPVRAQVELAQTAAWRLGAQDPAMLMVDLIGLDLDRRLAAAAKERSWPGAPGSASFRAKKARLAQILGVVDPRTAYPKIEISKDLDQDPLRVGGFEVERVKWPVMEGVSGEGLLLENHGGPWKRNLIVLVDPADLPEQWAGLLPGAEAKTARIHQAVQAGDRVWLLPLIDRRDDRSGSELLGRFTNQPHREFVYRMAFEMGRHLIGYEAQRVLGLVDALVRNQPDAPILLWGSGEGGVVALAAAALDERISKVGVSGSFGPREKVWAEPIYRNVWSYEKEFGDAGLAALLGERGLAVSNEAGPVVSGPPQPRAGRSGAAPGKLEPYALDRVQSEFNLALQHRTMKATNQPWSLQSSDAAAWPRFIGNREVPAPYAISLPPSQIKKHRAESDQRHDRLFLELVGHVQMLWRRGDRSRAQYFDGNAVARSGKWAEETAKKRAIFDQEIMGSLGQKAAPHNTPVAATSRIIYDTPEFRGWEVELPLSCAPGVFAQGIYLLPKNLKPGEIRPVVVCQHGLEGRPQDVCNPLARTPYYNSFGAELARKGYIVFAPQNPYIGQDSFRVLQRKANPLGLSLFSYITAQHRVILDWLKTRPEVDAKRLAFYGLSYGGKTAMRVPAILEDYCLSICSGDFNEWVGKNAAWETFGAFTSYMYTGEYEIYEWNLGNTFNYAEMAFLIAPRPFMVERGHDDGVGIDPMVSWEFAKVREVFARLGIPERTEIEYFLGGHEIRAKGTFEFLKKHLKYPE